MISFDAAIIGGGPAACSAALSLAKRGARVGIFSAPNAKQRPTETASPALKRVLTSLGAQQALSTCEPCFGIESDWGRKAPGFVSSVMDPQGNSWFVHRGRFDLCLRQAVRQVATVYEETLVEDVSLESDGVFFQSQGRKFCASWAVIATGSPFSGGRIARQEPTVLDSLVVFWSCLPQTGDSHVLTLEATDYGWWYFCRGENETLYACLVTDVRCARILRPSIPSVWNSLLRELNCLPKLQTDGHCQNVHVSHCHLAELPQKQGSRWVVAGDAALKLDPLGSSGVITALDSGQKAATAIADASAGNEGGPLQYQTWSDGLFKEFIRQRGLQYEAEERKRGSEFWSRRVSSTHWSRTQYL